MRPAVVLALSCLLLGACADEDLAVGGTSTAVTLPGLAASGGTGVTVRVTPGDPADRSRERPPLFFRYEVKSGDTVESVARQFGLTPDSVRWNNEGFSRAQPLAPGTLLELPSVDGILHRLRPGETLSEIASRYGVTAADVLGFAGNGLQAPGTLPPEGVILVPGGRRPTAANASAAPSDVPAAFFKTYSTVPGDTAATVAARFGLTVRTILRSNPDVPSAGEIASGTALGIPARDGILRRIGPNEHRQDVLDLLDVPPTYTYGAIGDSFTGPSEEWFFAPDP